MQYDELDLHDKTGRFVLRQVSSEGERTLVIRDLGSETGPRTISLSVPVIGPRISPDGRNVAFFPYGQISVLNMESMETRVVFDQKDLRAGSCSWSPDGSRLAFSAYEVPQDARRPPRVYCLDLGSGQAKEIPGEPGFNSGPEWSRTGRILAYRHRARTGVPWTITLVDMGSLETMSLPVDDGMGQDIIPDHWSSPDDRYAIVTEMGNDLARAKVIDLDDMSVAARSEDAGIRSAGFFPDGRSILFVRSVTLSQESFPGLQVISDLALGNLAPVRGTSWRKVIAIGESGGVVYFLGSDDCLYQWRPGIGGERVCRAPEEPQERQVGFTMQDYSFEGRDGSLVPVERYLPAHANGKTIVYTDGGAGKLVDSRHALLLGLLRKGYEVVRPVHRGRGGEESGMADARDIVDSGLDLRRRLGQPDARFPVLGYLHGGGKAILALTEHEAPWSCGVTVYDFKPESLPGIGLSRASEARQRSEDDHALDRACRIRHPLLIIHGDRDLMPTEDALRAQEAIQAAGGMCELLTIRGDIHGFYLNRHVVFERLFSFLDSHDK